MACTFVQLRFIFRCLLLLTITSFPIIEELGETLDYACCESEPDCEDNDDLVSGQSGYTCAQTVGAVGCDYATGSGPLSNFCPATCDTCPEGSSGCAEEGPPASCSAQCADAFLPIWDTCGDEMLSMGFDEDGALSNFVNQCGAAGAWDGNMTSTCEEGVCQEGGQWAEVSEGDSFESQGQCEQQCVAHPTATAYQYNGDGWCGCLTLDDSSFDDEVHGPDVFEGECTLCDISHHSDGSGCADDPDFTDVQGYTCKLWYGYDCLDSESFGYTAEQEQQIVDACPDTCGACGDSGH